MKGLFVKDFRLLKNQRKLLILSLPLTLLLSCTTESIFAVMFLTLLALTSAVGTISYDEFDRGFAFLFSLPFSRKDYVREKFLLALLFGAAGAFAGCLCTFAVGAVRDTGTDLRDLGDALLSALFLFCATAGVTIPLRIRFGSEGSRIVLLFIGAFYAMPFLLLDSRLSSFPLLLLPAIGLCLVVGGYLFSLRFVTKKDF